MIKRILRSSVSSIASRFFITVTNLFIIYYISRRLGNAELGNYGIAFFFQMFVSTVSSFSLYLFYGKEFARYGEKSSGESDLVSEFVTISVMGLILALVSPFAIFLLYKKITFSLIILSCLGGYILGVERNLGGFLLGKEEMPFESLSNFLSLLMVVVPLLLFPHFFHSVERILLLRIFSLGGAMGVKLVYVRGMFDFKKIRVRLSSFSEIKYYWFSGISSSILREADVFILSFFIDKSMLGGYFLALRIFYAFGTIAEVISAALTPFISSSYLKRADGEFRRFNRYMVPVFTFLALIFSILLLVSRNFILQQFSPENLVETGRYLFYFSFLLFFRFISFSTGIILTSADLQKARFAVMFTASVIILVLEIVLGSVLGIEGILISRGAAELFIFFMFGYYVNRLIKGEESLQPGEWKNPSG